MTKQLGGLSDSVYGKLTAAKIRCFFEYHLNIEVNGLKKETVTENIAHRFLSWSKSLWPFGIKNRITTPYTSLHEYVATLKDAGTRVTIKFHGDLDSYDCNITALNANHQVVVIDNLQPTIPSQLLTLGKTLTIETERGGRKVSLNSQFLGPLIEYGDFGYMLKIF